MNKRKNLWINIKILHMLKNIIIKILKIKIMILTLFNLMKI